MTAASRISGDDMKRAAKAVKAAGRIGAWQGRGQDWEGEEVKLVADSTAQDLLSQGLDLCARARALDKMEREAVQRQIREGTTRSLTVSLWAEEAYDRELAAWERRVRSYLSRFPRYTGGLVANPDGKPSEKDPENG